MTISQSSGVRYRRINQERGSSAVDLSDADTVGNALTKAATAAKTNDLDRSGGVELPTP